MGNLASVFRRYKPPGSNNMQMFPRDLADLLSDSKSEEWVPKFKEYLVRADQKAKPARPWRANRLELLLKLRELTALRDKLDSQNSEEKKQNLENERDSKFEEIRTTFFNERDMKRVALSDPQLWNKVASYSTQTSKSCVFQLVNDVILDSNMWSTLSNLCMNFLKTSPFPTMAVLLSIL